MLEQTCEHVQGGRAQPRCDRVRVHTDGQYRHADAHRLRIDSTRDNSAISRAHGDAKSNREQRCVVATDT